MGAGLQPRRLQAALLLADASPAIGQGDLLGGVFRMGEVRFRRVGKLRVAALGQCGSPLSQSPPPGIATAPRWRLAAASSGLTRNTAKAPCASSASPCCFSMSLIEETIKSIVLPSFNRRAAGWAIFKHRKAVAGSPAD